MVSNNVIAAGAILLPNVGGYLSGLPVQKNMTWYNTLKKPDWRPPAWAFAPVWGALYSSMGYASYIVWREGGGCSGPARLPLLIYGGKLALNLAWTPLFFHAHKLKLSFYDILALDAAAITTGYLFYQIKPLAGLLFIPYCAWLGLATMLTYRIVTDNPEVEAQDAKIVEIKDE